MGGWEQCWNSTMIFLHRLRFQRPLIVQFLLITAQFRFKFKAKNCKILKKFLIDGWRDSRKRWMFVFSLFWLGMEIVLGSVFCLVVLVVTCEVGLNCNNTLFFNFSISHLTHYYGLFLLMYGTWLKVQMHPSLHLFQPWVCLHFYFLKLVPS